MEFHLETLESRVTGLVPERVPLSLLSTPGQLNALSHVSPPATGQRWSQELPGHDHGWAEAESGWKMLLLAQLQLLSYSELPPPRGAPSLPLGHAGITTLLSR